MPSHQLRVSCGRHRGRVVRALVFESVGPGFESDSEHFMDSCFTAVPCFQILWLRFKYPTGLPPARWDSEPCYVSCRQYISFSCSKLACLWIRGLPVSIVWLLQIFIHLQITKFLLYQWMTWYMNVFQKMDFLFSSDVYNCNIYLQILTQSTTSY